MDSRTTGRDGRVERKKRQTRERLYEAAIALITAKGYDTATMGEIAEAADTARGTAFNHFPSKADFVYEWTARRRERARRVSADALGEDASTGEQLRAYFGELATINVEQFGLTRNMMIGWLRAGGSIEGGTWFTEELVSLMEHGQRRGDIRADTGAWECARLLYDAYIGLLLHWVRDPAGPAFDLVPALNGRIDLVLHGISGE